MTSKSLYYDILKQDIKRRLWAFLLVCISLLFSMPILVLLKIGRYNARYGTAENYPEAYQRVLNEYFIDTAFFSDQLRVVIIVISVFLGFIAFAYLHSKKQIDFYHSLPLKREQLFTLRFITGVLFYTIAYLISLITTVILSGFYVVPFKLMLKAGIQGLIINLVFFLLIYIVVTLSAVLTGHLLVNLLAAAALLLYSPAICFLADSLKYAFFRNAYYGYNDWEGKSQYLSPVTAYLEAVSRHQAGIRLSWFLSGALIIAAVSIAFTVFLYKRRPSEAAGQALAFSIIKMPIKIGLVIPLSVFCGLLLYSFTESPIWMIFGMLCGALFFHGLIEVIYQFDFTGIIRHKLQLLICCAAASVILGSFYFDLTGFDSYLPKEEKLLSVAIKIPGFQGWNDMIYVGQQDENVFSWGISNKDGLETMSLTNFTGVLKLAEAGIERSERAKQSNLAELEQEAEYFTSVDIQYQLKNGKTVRRSYYLPLSMEMAGAEMVFSDIEYKQGTYVIMDIEAGDVADVTISFMSEKQDLFLDEAEKNVLLEAYQKDFTALNMTDFLAGNIIGEIRFLTTEQAEIMESYKQRMGSRERYTDECFYPIYESFTNTMALLTEYGGVAERWNLSDDIYRLEIKPEELRFHRDLEASLGIRLSTEDYDRLQESESFIYNKEADIKELMTDAVYSEYLKYQGFSGNYGSIQAYINENGVRKKYEFKIPLKVLPDLIRTDLENLLAE